MKTKRTGQGVYRPSAALVSPTISPVVHAKFGAYVDGYFHHGNKVEVIFKRHRMHPDDIAFCREVVAMDGSLKAYAWFDAHPNEVLTCHQ